MDYFHVFLINLGVTFRASSPEFCVFNFYLKFKARFKTQSENYMGNMLFSGIYATRVENCSYCNAYNNGYFSAQMHV